MQKLNYGHIPFEYIMVKVTKRLPAWLYFSLPVLLLVVQAVVCVLTNTYPLVWMLNITTAIVVGLMLIHLRRSETQTAFELLESKEELGSIIESAMDAVVIVDESQMIVVFNEAAEVMFQRGRAAVIGQPLDFLLPERFRSAHMSLLREFGDSNVTRRAMGALGSVYGLRSDGTEFPVEASISQVTLSTGRFYTAMLRDVTARQQSDERMKHLLASEQAARAALEHTSRMKDEFLATVSHELRTPLTAIMGWTYLLKRTGDKEQLLRGLDIVDKQAIAQNRLIADILDLSKINRGQVRLERKRCDLIASIQAAVETVMPAAAAKQVDFEVEGPQSMYCMADPNRIQQIVWNLLSNAVKFTHRGGHVRLSVSRGEGRALVEVSDDGEGISADFLPHVFERFRQADGSRSRSHGGLGLGLSIVKHLVELHGGRVMAHSDGLGTGSRFEVELPVTECGEAGLAFDGPGVDFGFSRAYKVLVVEDDDSTLEMLVTLLETAGLEVETANSAITAREKLSFFVADLIISDISMPEEDGYKFIRSLRERGVQTPAIALTAHAAAEDRREALAAGFSFYIPKPMDLPELMKAIERLCTSRSVA